MTTTIEQDIMFLEHQAQKDFVHFDTIQCKLKTFDGTPTSDAFDPEMDYPEGVWSREQWLLYVSFCAYTSFLKEQKHRNITMEKALRFFPSAEISEEYNNMVNNNPTLFEFYKVFSKLSTEAYMAVGY